MEARLRAPVLSAGRNDCTLSAGAPAECSSQDDRANRERRPSKRTVKCSYFRPATEAWATLARKRERFRDGRVGEWQRCFATGGRGRLELTSPGNKKLTFAGLIGIAAVGVGATITVAQGQSYPE